MKLPVSGRTALTLPFATPTEYGLGKSGWVTARFRTGDTVPIEMLKEWIEESFRAVAPSGCWPNLKRPKRRPLGLRNEKSSVALCIIRRERGRWEVCDSDPRSPANCQAQPFLTRGGATIRASNPPKSLIRLVSDNRLVMLSSNCRFCTIRFRSRSSCN